MQIVLDGGGPILVRALDKRTIDDDAGIADENVEAAEGLDRRLDQALGIGFLRDIGLDRDRLPFGLADAGGHGLSGLLVLDVIDHHPGPVAGKALGNRLADPARTARDDGNLVPELHDAALPALRGRLRARVARCNRAGWGLSFPGRA